MLFTGETITAEQALAWGLVNRVVDDGTALDGARALAATIAARGPLSNRLAKELVDAAQDVPLDAASVDVDGRAAARSSTAATCTRAWPRSSRSAPPRIQGTMRPANQAWKRSRQTKRRS